MKGAPLNKVFSPKGQEEKKQQRPQGEAKQQRRQDDDGGAFGGSEFLVGYAPGSPAEVLRPGQGKLVKAGSDIVFSCITRANGTPGKDHSKIGLVFAKGRWRSG